MKIMIDTEKATYSERLIALEAILFRHHKLADRLLSIAKAWVEEMKTGMASRLLEDLTDLLKKAEEQE